MAHSMMCSGPDLVHSASQMCTLEDWHWMKDDLLIIDSFDTIVSYKTKEDNQIFIEVYHHMLHQHSY